MKLKSLLILLFSALLLGGFYWISKNYDFPKKKIVTGTAPATIPAIQNGDIIFHISQSSQSVAIQKATKSNYSHCGIIYIENNKQYVFEAVQPVKLTPLDKWIARGKDGHYIVKRLKEANNLLTPDAITKMQKEGKKFMGKAYDLNFEWSDDKIYCSELIWKIYKRALDIELGKLEKLKDFDLSDKIVTAKLKERYGENVPLEEPVISPVAIYNSDLLITVLTH